MSATLYGDANSALEGKLTMKRQAVLNTNIGFGFWDSSPTRITNRGGPPPSSRTGLQGAPPIHAICQTVPVPVSTGDHVSQGKQKVVSLTFSGGDVVLIPELTVASLHGWSDGTVVVKLEAGSLSVLNKSRSLLAVMAGGARVVPVNRPALFDVMLHNDAARVIARDGAARLETANRTAVAIRGAAVTALMSPSASRTSVAGLRKSNAVLYAAARGTISGVVVGGIAYAERLRLLDTLTEF
jgi:hypothetical protein